MIPKIENKKYTCPDCHKEVGQVYGDPKEKDDKKKWKCFSCWKKNK